MSPSWRRPPRRIDGPFEDPPRSRRDVALDRFVAGLIGLVWIGFIFAIASCVAAS